MASLDNFWVAVQFFGVAVFLVLAVLFWNSITSTSMNTEIWSKTEVGVAAKSNAGVAYSNLDNLGLAVYIALHLGILIVAFLLRSHPVVYIAAIFLIAILGMIAAPLSNAYEQTINSNSDLTVAAATLPKVNFLMANLPKFEIIWGFISAIVLFGLARGSGLL